MMLAGFFFLLLVTDGSTNNSSEHPNLQMNHEDDVNSTDMADTNQRSEDGKSSNECFHRDVYGHLNLTKNIAMAMIWPGSNTFPIWISLEVLLYSILDVNEKDQQFISYILVNLKWKDPGISWDRDDFCGIRRIYPPPSVLWRPDIVIEEMIESNKVESPHVTLDFNGGVSLWTNMVVVSTCAMEVYKFPFDVQSCKLTFKSTILSEYEIKLVSYGNTKWRIEWSLKKMTQSEWLLTNLTMSKEIVDNFYSDLPVLVYTITMKRRSALYVANFLVPILLFLSLDLTSFLISDNGGEKLSFKVTVLLAVTVMQLILNDILPSSSDRIPLVVVFCIGIFGLMMLSLVETIVVMRLLEKDKVGKANRGTELKNRTPAVCNVSVDETPSEQLSKEDNSSQPTEEFNALEKMTDELKEIEKTLTQVPNSTKEEGKPGYWTRVAKIVDIVFFFFYVTAVSVLLSVLFILWNEPEDQ